MKASLLEGGAPKGRKEFGGKPNNFMKVMIRLLIWEAGGEKGAIL